MVEKSTPEPVLKVSASELRASCPLLRLKNIRVGDVLLTRGNRDKRLAHLESMAIAAGSGGRFSHAALWLPSGWEGPPETNQFGYAFDKELVESDDHGVGHTWLARTILRSAKVRGEDVAILSDRVVEAVVVRHPEILHVSREAIQAAAANLRNSELHRKYPQLHRLAGATIFPGFVKSSIRALATYLDRSRRGVDHSGSFCSEFVMKFFQQLPGFAALKQLDPSTIPPGFFAVEGNGFEVVSDAVILADDIDDSAEGLLPFSQNKDFSRAASLSKLIELASQGRESHARWQDTAKLSENVLAKQKAMHDVVVMQALRRGAAKAYAIRVTLEKQNGQILALLSHKELYDGWRSQDIADDLLKTSTFLVCLANYLHDVAEEKEVWLDPDKRDAMVELHSIAAASAAGLSKQVSTYSHRWALRLVRLSSKPAEEKKAERASLIDEWLAARKAFAALDRQKPVTVGTASYGCQRLVEAVIKCAREDAAAILASRR